MIGLEQSIVQEMERHLTPAEFKFVESKLYNYVDNKAVIKAWEQSREDILNETPSRDGGMPSGGQVSDPTQAKAIRLSLLEAKAYREKYWIDAVDGVLELLDKQDRELVELKYFSGRKSSNDVLAQLLNMSRSDFYRKRKEIVWRFANRFGIV